MQKIACRNGAVLSYERVSRWQVGWHAQSCFQSTCFFLACQGCQRDSALRHLEGSEGPTGSPFVESKMDDKDAELLAALEELIGERAIQGLYRVSIREPSLRDRAGFRAELDRLDLAVVERTVAGVPVWDVWWEAVSSDYYDTDLVDERPFELQPKRKDQAFQVALLYLVGAIALTGCRKPAALSVTALSHRRETNGTRQRFGVSLRANRSAAVHRGCLRLCRESDFDAPDCIWRTSLAQHSLHGQPETHVPSGAVVQCGPAATGAAGSLSDWLP
jgi:hypothetical protein